MRKILMVLITFLLIAQSAICQTGYPKRIKIGNDSVVAFTNYQVKEFHKLVIRYDNIIQDSAVLRTMLNNCNELLNLKSDQYNNAEKIVHNYQGEITIYKTKEELYNKKVTQLTRANARYRVVSICGISVSAVLGVLLILK